MAGLIPSRQLRISRVIQVSFITFLFCYLALVLVAAGTVSGEETGLDAAAARVMTWTLAVVSAMEAAMAWLLPRLIMGDRRLSSIMRSANPTVPVAGGVLKPFELLTSGLKNVHPMMAGVMAERLPMIIRLALLHAIAIQGMLLALMACNPVYFYPFGAVSLAGTLLWGPDINRILRLYQQLQNDGVWPESGAEEGSGTR